jgi:6-phosphofructokinase 1
MRGAMQIGERGARIAVVGVPKTIDNDIPYLDPSFGFQTAYAHATESIHAVTVEAKSPPHGVGLVKRMSQRSGFITCYSALARNDAEVVLIPEVAFQLTGTAACCITLQ